MYYKYIILPFIGALIGWFTNYLAVRMLFRPYNPVKIPFLSFTIQGLIPKRRIQLADSIAEAVEKELLPRDILLSKVHEMNLEKEIISVIDELINKKLNEKLPDFLPVSVKNYVKEYIKKISKEGLNDSLDDILNNLQEKVIDQAELGKLVKNKIESFPLEKIEEIVLRISSNELKHIELLGGILGFIIGLGQAIFLILFE